MFGVWSSIVTESIELEPRILIIELLVNELSKIFVKASMIAF